MKKSGKKQDFEAVKKTVMAHGTMDEEEAKKKAESLIEVTEKLIESENGEDLVAIKDEDSLKVVEAVVEGKVEAIPVRAAREVFGVKSREEIISEWEPKTKLGRDVKN